MGGEEGAVPLLDYNALLLGIIPVVAGGIGYLVDRSYKRADARRTEMYELLKKQRDEAEAEADEAKAEAKSEIATARAQAAAEIAAARAEVAEAQALTLAYWQLLVKNGIDPVPPLTRGSAT